MSPVSFPSGLLVDASTKLTVSSASALAASVWMGQRVRGVFRYVGLHQPVPGYDIDPQERDAILGAGLLLGLVQHCRNPGWTASGPLGQLDGTAAAHCAMIAGYEPGAHLALDLEGLANVGQPVIDHCEAWAGAVLHAGWTPLLYVGYACGLTPDQLWGLPSFHLYWSDFGQRYVTNRGFALKQSPQVTIAGVPVDPNVASVDALGGVLQLMAA